MKEQDKIPRFFCVWIGVVIGIAIAVSLSQLGYYNIITKLISFWCYGSFILLFLYAILLLIRDRVKTDKLKGGQKEWMKQEKKIGLKNQ